jgi:hypothetical protein
METQVLDFIPPVAGLDTEFNTFRLGGALVKRLKEGDEVFLMDGKNKVVFGRAQVLRIEAGRLGELCLMHAAKNHRELANDPNDAPERLFKYLQKLYGPHIATATKKSCVIYMRRLE